MIICISYTIIFLSDDDMMSIIVYKIIDLLTHGYYIVIRYFQMYTHNIRKHYEMYNSAVYNYFNF